MPIDLDFGGTDDMGFQPIDEGVYTGYIDNAELTATKDGTGQYIKVIVKINDGPAKGRILFDNWSLPNPSKQDAEKQKLMLSFLRARLEAVTNKKWDQDGMQLDVKELPGYHVKVVVIQDTYNNQITNKIKTYLPTDNTESGGESVFGGF